MNHQMCASIGFCFAATGLAMITGLTDAPVEQRVALVTVEALTWGAGFMFARSMFASRAAR